MGGEELKTTRPEALNIENSTIPRVYFAGKVPAIPPEVPTAVGAQAIAGGAAEPRGRRRRRQPVSALLKSRHCFKFWFLWCFTVGVWVCVRLLKVLYDTKTKRFVKKLVYVFV